MNVVSSAQDYDAWGHLQPDRSYSNSSMKYDYTGKERDNESNYDYFGARYYDSKIGRWGQLEPLYSINLEVTPFIYCNSNPVIFKDYKGLDEYYYTEGSFFPIRYPKDGDDEYYFEHPEGNWEVTEATGRFSILKGKTFYKGASQLTGSFYKNQKDAKGLAYTSKDIVTNFLSEGIADVIQQVSGRKDINQFEVAWLSRTNMPFDYKQDMSLICLYLFGNLVYNQQEAGNILWGMTISYYDIPLWEAHIGGNLYKLREFQLDEPNEVAAYEKGYFYFKNNPFIEE